MQFPIGGVIVFVSLFQSKKVLVFHSEFGHEGSFIATADHWCSAKVVIENIPSLLCNILAWTVCL